MEQLEFIRNGGETRRFHTIPVLRSQNVAEHSFNVTMLLWAMYGNDEPGITIALLMAGMTHDLAEHKVGDIPAPAKRGMSEEFPDFRAKWGEMEENLLRTVQLDWDHMLTDDERRKLKLADAMEGALYCIRERMMGNKLIAGCYRNFRNYILGEASELEAEQEMIVYIEEQWEVACAS